MASTEAKGSVLGSSGLLPGDGLLVVDPQGLVAWGPRPREPEKGFKFPWQQRRTVPAGPEPPRYVLEHGTPLVVVEGDPGTYGVLATTTGGTVLVVTDIDMKVGTVVALSRSGNVRGL